MSHRILRLVASLSGFLLLLVLLALSHTPPARAAMELLPAGGLLNPDGTLNLAAQPQGTVDLRGWNVTLDAARGPVFAPATGVNNAPAAAVGDWSALGSGVVGGSLNDQVIALAISGTNVYVGGDFTDVNNNGIVVPEADYVAKWDGANWSAIGSDGAGGGSLNSTVRALAFSGTDLYVGGNFFNVNDNGIVVPEADYVARWDGTNWSALGSNGAGEGSLNFPVYALAVSGTDLYVGGFFTEVNDNGTVLTAADRIARWDGTNWNALSSDGALNGSLTNGVYDLAVSGTDVYVGGIFTDVNDNGTVLTEADYVAKWDGTNWSALGSNGAADGSLNNEVYVLAVNGTDLYVGGSFTDVNDNGTSLPEADYVARWDGTNWSALGSNGASDGSLNLPVSALAFSGTDVYVGGYFTDVNDNGTVLPEADFVARWDGANWSALGSNGAGDGSLNNLVTALAFSGTDLYVGGVFSDVNDNGTVLPEADYSAKWDGTNWSALGSTGLSGSLNNLVNALAISGTDVYVGGNFIDVNNNGTSLPEADYVAKWDGTNWSALGSDGAGNGSLNNVVIALAVSGTDLYVGGSFTDVNNNGIVVPEADFIARWDGANWSALGSDGAGEGSLNSCVCALAVSGTDVYVGGEFTNVNDNGTVLTEADYIARWDGTNWSALGSDGAGGGSLDSYVYALAVSGTDVYVGGFFTDVNNNGTVLPAADWIGRWDGASWSALGSNGASDGSLNGVVFALAVSGTDLYVGGGFIDVNNNGALLTNADYVAKWDGTNWSALGSNGASDGSLTNVVLALAVSGTDMYVGGGFVDVNDNGTVLPAADYIAKWDGTNWSALGSDGAGGGSLNSQVNALAVSGNGMYVGGLFTNVNDNGTVLPADYIAPVQILEPTAVTLTEFSAKPNATKKGTQLKWVTGTELQVVGFNVWMRESKNGEDTNARAWKQLNKQLIAAKHPGSVESASYSRMHKKVRSGTRYSYKLEVVKAAGTSEWSDVVKVTAP